MYTHFIYSVVVFFFQAEDGIRDLTVTGVQTCALPIFRSGGGSAVLARVGARLIGHCGTSLTVRCGTSPACRCDTSVAAGRRRSEERRVGKECRSRCWPYHQKKKAPRCVPTPPVTELRI